MTEDPGVSSTVRQERIQIPGKVIVLAGAILMALSAASVGVMDLILRSRWAGHEYSSVARPAMSAFIASPLQRSNIEDRALGQERQEHARRQLDEWGWVEKGKVARIPVDEATRLMLQDARRGGLVWPSPAAKSLEQSSTRSSSKATQVTPEATP